MNETAVRSLAGRATGAISMNNFYGKTAFTPLVYEFTSTTQSWAGTNATLSASGGALIVNSTANDPIVRSPSGTTWPGSGGVVIKIFIRRTSGTGWDGSVYYTTGAHGESESFKNLMPEPVWDGTYKLIEMNMSNLVAGGTDYVTNTITRLRLDFGLTAVDDFQVDRIEITTGTLYAGGLYQYNASGYHNDNVNYFDGTDPVTALTTIQESSIPENESRLWIGYFYSRIGGDYVFNMSSDDGAYLWLGETAITGYTTLNRNLFTTFNTETLSTDPITLTENTYTPIRLMMGNGVGPGYVFLSFDTPGLGTITNGTGYFLHNSATFGF
jgi:hypothetical protein